MIPYAYLVGLTVSQSRQFHIIWSEIEQLEKNDEKEGVLVVFPQLCSYHFLFSPMLDPNAIKTVVIMFFPNYYNIKMRRYYFC